MQNGTIALINDETNNVKGFTIRIKNPFSFIPGQFVMLAFPDSPDIKKAFSIVDYDAKTKEFFLLIKKAGQFTTKLFGSGQGTILQIHGPYGSFTLPKSQKPLVLIAGGVGITPLYCMMYHIKKSGYAGTASLYYSTKKKDDMVLLDRLLDIDDPRIKVNLFFYKGGSSWFWK